MKEPRDEFLEQIKNTLLGHEEPYDEGAWERFAAKNITTVVKKKPVIPIWKWAAAAAAILAGAIFLFQYFNAPNTVTKEDAAPVVKNLDVKQDSLGNTKNILPDTASQQMATTPQNNFNNDTQQKPYNASPIITEIFTQNQKVLVKTADTPVAPTPQPIVAQKPVEPNKQAQPQENPVTKPFWENKIEQPDIANKPTPQKNNDPVVAATQPLQKKEKAGKATKWASSLFLSPNLGNDGVNMGYGYSLGYAINDKIKISSGVAYAKVSASKNYNTPQPPTAVALDASVAVNSYARNVNSSNYSPTTYLQSVNSWVSGIDVPLEVSYKVSKKLYSTAGVSGLFVLKGKNTNTYIDEMKSVVTVNSSQGSPKEYSNLEMKSAPLNLESPADNTSFIGFYNASIGFKQKITNKNSVSVEPFIKIPMKQVTDQKLNYRGVGLRLKFDF